MAFRIGDLVLGGVFCNSAPYCVHGTLLLRGCEAPFMFELTGAPSPDLRGRSFEFTVPANEREPSDEDRRLTRAFAAQQIGATGDMTAAHRVKVYDCPPEDLPRLLELKQLPSTSLHQCLYLEWFSQNGRVVAEIIDPQIVPIDESPEAPLGTIDEAPVSDDAEFSASDFAEIHEEETPHFPDAARELDLELEEKARRIDREISGQSDDGDDFLGEMEAFEDAIENGPGLPLRSVLADLDLPAPGPELTDAQAYASLQAATGCIAMMSVAYHICEHCSIQEAYRIFMEEVCNESALPGMPGSFVQHFTTSDFCPKCMEE